MQRRIFWSMLAVVAVALVIALAATSVLRQRLLDDRQRELTRQAEVAASLIGEQLARVGGDDARARPRIRLLLEQVKRIGGHDHLEAAVVTGRNGIAPVLAESLLIEAVRPQADQLIGSDQRFRTFEAELAGIPIFTTLQLIELDGGVASTVLVAIAREEPLLRDGVLASRVWLAFGVGAVLAAVLAAVLSRRIGRRLGGVGDAARRIAGGDFSARAAVSGDDDITMLAATFNDMADQLEESRKREREFLLSVGHDLRTPLTTIRGYAEGLHAGIITTDDLPRVARVLDSQTTRLSRLVEDLMLLARLEAREFTMRLEPVDLAAHVRGLLDAEGERARKLAVRLETLITDVGVVTVDPDRFAQLLGNLLDNAFRYSPEGSAVTVGLQRTDGGVRLTVADAGPGIEEADLPRVFERLYVAQRYQALRPEGSGLGLSIVHELVEAMSGAVEVRSVVGMGTELVVTIDVTHHATGGGVTT